MERRVLVCQILYCLMNKYATLACSYNEGCYECYHNSHCPSGHICQDGYCIRFDTSNDSSKISLSSNTILNVIGAIAALIFLICCCARQRRNERNDNVNTTLSIVTMDRSSTARSVQQNRNVRSEEMSSVNEQPERVESRTHQISSLVTISGPQSYSEVGHETEAPPPSYEEVMRASPETVIHEPANKQRLVVMKIYVGTPK